MESEKWEKYGSMNINILFPKQPTRRFQTIVKRE